MLETRNSTEANPNTALFSFKPRQVLLAEHNRKMTAPAKKKQDKNLTLNLDKNDLLHHSILRFLQQNGFPKTLKRFLSEAQIENDDWKTSSFDLDLEDMYCKYMETRTHLDTNLNTYVEQELGGDGTAKKDGNCNCATYEEITKKKKKNGSDDSDCIAMADIMATESEAKPKEKKKSKSSLDSPSQTEQVELDVLRKSVDDVAQKFKIDDSIRRPKDRKKKTEAFVSEPSASTAEQENLLSGETEEKSKDLASSICNAKTDSGPEVKHKNKKKKKKSSTDSPVGDVEHCGLSNKLDVPLEEKKNDSKDKKGKKEDSFAQTISGGVDQVNLVRAETENEAFRPSAHAPKKEKKSSKKRKRLASDENEHHSTEMEASEESKRRKTEGLKEANNKDLLVEGNAFKESKGEHVQVDHNEPPKMSMIQLDGHQNGKLEMNGGEKTGSHKATRKQHNGSAEPKTVHAFQRVKLVDVVFADEKLQDNSYWAKNGAEAGYGAKAQEVLGQVKGRDFRHEKTKKKRGSYRGGQIDLQSHSIKFNYSDDD